MTVSEPRLPEGTPWVETREGGWFFVNALLVAPAFMVAFPWTLRWLLGMAGVASGPNRFLDTIPTIAAFIVPYVGWLAVLPLATTIHALRLVGPGRARWALRAFLLVHAGVLAYTIWWWAFSRTFPEVGP